MSNKRKDDKIVHINSKEYGGSGKDTYYSGGILSKFTPELVGAIVFSIVFIYLCINLYIYSNKKQLSIYEVQAENISFDTSYTGVCLRDETIAYSDYSGYVNYYIQNGRKCAKSSVLYSIDESGNNIYKTLNDSMEDISFSDDEIREIKAMLLKSVQGNNECDLSSIGKVKDEITYAIYDYVSRNTLDKMNALVDAGSGKSDFHSVRAKSSGVVSYKTDNYCGFGIDDLSPGWFDKDKSVYISSDLRYKGLVSKGDPVYRICSDEEWSIVAKVTEEFYVNNLENRTATIMINGDITPIQGGLNLIRRDNDYYAQILLSDYMSKFIDDRIVKIEFSYDTEKGLKIPLSAVTKKSFYLIPMTVFNEEDGYHGLVLKKEVFNQQTGETEYRIVYPDKYYSDGYYAYIDMTNLSEGDYLVNTATGERVKVATVNELDGVYCVNKGYYVFARIEKLRSNNEYTIVKRNSEGGLKLYDHIALNASDAIEGDIIY